ncbi:MAG: glutaminyl-peptide cyclotransferase [Polyangiales bacterium]
MAKKRKSTPTKKPDKARAAKKSAPKRSPKTTSSGGGKWLVAAGVAGLAAIAAMVYAQGDVDSEAREVSNVEVVEPAAEPELIVTVPESLQVRVQSRYPHDRQAFTQGLLWHEGKIYESTGRYGHSTLRRVDLATGRVEQEVALDDGYFAEGLARVGERLFQLTWQSHKAFVYDLDTFERVAEFDYETEGWGLCYNGTDLVMSDGSSTLFFRDPSDFSVRREVNVMKAGRPLRNLNELECVDGDVYANVWQRDEIVRIDPSSGTVEASIRASGLLDRDERRGTDVLNGIAYLPDSRRFLITGKMWPVAFEVDFEER